MQAEESFDVLVIGAGPAGAAAARALSRQGVAVLLCERGSLPRHRLCGEFVSPEAVADLAALDLDLARQGAVRVDAGSLAAGESITAHTAFPAPAYALSRFVLDCWLATSAARAGATLRTECRVADLEGDSHHGFSAALHGRHPSRVRARFVIAATGKHPAALGPRPEPHGSPGWMAFKTHLRAAPIAALELHAIDGGYIGFAPVEAGRTNVCAVVQAGALPGARAGGAAGALAALVRRVPRWQAQWASAQLDPAVSCSESGARFGVATPVWGDVLRAGDAAALPHPVGGDGIAMALRAGRLAAACVAGGLGGTIAPGEVATRYAAAWKREFGSRLRWCAWAHGALERPWVARPLLATLAGWPAGMRFWLERTRGDAAAVPQFFSPEVQV